MEKDSKFLKKRGTATINVDTGDIDFRASVEGQPVQKSVRKMGDSKFYETEGEKTSSYVAHLKVSKDSADPAAEMEEQLDSFIKGFRKKEPKQPSSKALMEKPGVTVWHRKAEKKVVVRMEIDLTVRGELSSQLFNLTAEVNKCFAINQKNLSTAK